jgi:hypothetical protein
MPKVVYKEDTPVTEMDLTNLIHDTRVEDAITVFDLLESKGIGMHKFEFLNI